MTSPSKINILLVDDRPEQLLALEALLDEPGVNIVKAPSGKDALRCLLSHDFALVLLDVNMPGMDGFETASLIRQRPRSSQTPIMFVTALSETETHLSRGYSLGAVDYIHTPVVPEVLKTKVGVFVELFRRTEEVRQHAKSFAQEQQRKLDEEQKRAAWLKKLTTASLEVNSAPEIKDILQIAADQACKMLDARLAVIRLAADPKGPSRGAMATTSADVPEPVPPEAIDSPFFARAFELKQPLRLTAAELLSHPVLGPLAPVPGVHPRLHGWLSTSLPGRDGRDVGWIAVSGKVTAEFMEEDERLLEEMARIASVAVENALYREAREANRLKDEFLAVLSHELRTPLNAMLGWTQLLRTGKLDAADGSRALEIIERNIKVQTHLIEDLLEVSRIITGKVQLAMDFVEFAAVVQAAIDVLRPEADSKEVRMETVLESEEEKIAGDADRLQQVVLNLLSNAIKFTPKGGRVEVLLRRSKDDLELSVLDTGEGIRPELLPYVFDRFRQGDSSRVRSHGGLGLGLTIVRHLVELHGGVVEARSEGQGRGATFVVRIPVAKGAAGSPRLPRFEKAGSLPTLKGLRVLLVDDEADARDLVVAALGGSGAEVTAVGSVREALEALDRCRPDVIVSDISMPDEDGYSLIRRVRERLPEQGGMIPAMALTASARGEDRSRALSAGFQIHVSKPIEIGELIPAVADLARRATRSTSE